MSGYLSGSSEAYSRPYIPYIHLNLNPVVMLNREFKCLSPTNPSSCRSLWVSLNVVLDLKLAEEFWNFWWIPCLETCEGMLLSTPMCHPVISVSLSRTHTQTNTHTQQFTNRNTDTHLYAPTQTHTHTNIHKHTHRGLLPSTLASRYPDRQDCCGGIPRHYWGITA